MKYREMKAEILGEDDESGDSDGSGEDSEEETGGQQIVPNAFH